MVKTKQAQLAGRPADSGSETEQAGKCSEQHQQHCAGQALASQQLSVSHLEAISSTAFVYRYLLPNWQGVGSPFGLTINSFKITFLSSFLPLVFP